MLTVYSDDSQRVREEAAEDAVWRGSSDPKQVRAGP